MIALFIAKDYEMLTEKIRTVKFTKKENKVYQKLFIKKYIKIVSYIFVLKL